MHIFNVYFYQTQIELLFIIHRFIPYELSLSSAFVYPCTIVSNHKF